jgi:hypothetical protein
MDRSLVGGQVQRIAVSRIGHRDVAVLQVRVPGETVHVVVVGGLGVGLVDDELRARLRGHSTRTPSPTQPSWRAKLENARVSAVGPREVELVRDGVRFRAADRAGGLRLDAIDRIEGDPAPLETLETGAPPWAALAERGARIVADLERTGSGDRRDALRRAIAKAVARVERRIAAVHGDLAKMQATEAAADFARLFVAEAARAPRGATALRTQDWTHLGPNGEPQTIEMALDPAKGAREQLEALFRRARRLKDGGRVARARLAEAARARDGLAALAAALVDPAAAVDFEAIEHAARAAAPRDFKLVAGPPRQPPGRRSQATDARPPYRAFTGHAGAPVYVGRGAAQNDALTLRVARPHDLWLHAKGRAGAHVVVPLDKGSSCPPELLVDAAHLAAHFSDARGERVVEVQYTPRRYLRKPRGSAPGAVVVDREKVLVLRVEDERLARLLLTDVDG